MKPSLSFEMLSILVADIGPKSSIPSISASLNLQNRQQSRLSEDDGLFLGYGALSNSFPYRQRGSYTRQEKTSEIQTAVLENDYLKATFLPTLGGRLWSLIDKTTGKNLLYTNDVLRPSNLAVKNAWFSGGVEWNIGVIGHSPFTTEPLFVAELETPQGEPILRMYEFERIRGVVFQMDFWLTPESRFLTCRMRVQNDHETLRPMYWWSNIAVPEHKGGRLVVPATKAYTPAQEDGYVVKTPIPEVRGVDISYYSDIPLAVDYFFDVTNLQEKYIASFDAEGYGLLQTSTSRMRGRKIFSWGHTTGARKWQDYLTNNAGDYIEIQAGLERTQYGCVPMPPNTVWEWIELYGPLQMPKNKVFGSYKQAVAEVTKAVAQQVDYDALELTLRESKNSIAKKKAHLKFEASGYGALENNLRNKAGLAPIAPHLDFGKPAQDQKQWLALLEKGAFLPQNPNQPPESYMQPDNWLALLEASVTKQNKENWYAWYQLALLYLQENRLKDAQQSIHNSLNLQETCWGHHALAVIATHMQDNTEVRRCAKKATLLRKEDLALAKDCLRLLLDTEGYTDILALIPEYSDTILQDGRVQLIFAYAHFYTDNLAEADRILNGGEGLTVADVREGEDLLTNLWLLVEQAKNPHSNPDSIVVPLRFDFRMKVEE